MSVNIVSLRKPFTGLDPFNARSAIEQGAKVRRAFQSDPAAALSDHRCVAGALQGIAGTLFGVKEYPRPVQWGPVPSWSRQGFDGEIRHLYAPLVFREAIHQVAGEKIGEPQMGMPFRVVGRERNRLLERILRGDGAVLDEHGISEVKPGLAVVGSESERLLDTRLRLVVTALGHDEQGEVDQSPDLVGIDLERHAVARFGVVLALQRSQHHAQARQSDWIAGVERQCLLVVFLRFIESPQALQIVRHGMVRRRVVGMPHEKSL